MSFKELIDCPACCSVWYSDLDESGVPYSCYVCCNGTRRITAEDVAAYNANSQPEIAEPCGSFDDPYYYDPSDYPST